MGFGTNIGGQWHWNKPPKLAEEGEKTQNFMVKKWTGTQPIQPVVWSYFTLVRLGLFFIFAVAFPSPI